MDSGVNRRPVKSATVGSNHRAVVLLRRLGASLTNAADPEVLCHQAENLLAENMGFEEVAILPHGQPDLGPAFAAVPIPGEVEAEPWGTIWVRSGRRQPLSSQDRQILETAATFLGSVLSRMAAETAVAFGTRAVEERTRHLSLIYKLNRAIAQGVDLPGLLGLVADRLPNTIRADRIAAIRLLGEEGAEYVAVSPEGDVPLGTRCVLPPAKLLDPSRPTVLDGDDAWQAFACSPLALAGCRTFCAFPLVVDQVCRGFFCLWARKPDAFGEANLEFLEVVASQLSVGLSSAEAQRSLKAVEAMRSEFVQTASHELRTPLTVMKGYADILTAGTPDPEDLRQYLARIKEACASLTDIVGSLVEIMQMDERARKVELAAFAPIEAVRRLVPLLAERHRGRTILVTCESDFMPGKSLHVAIGDPGLAEKVLWHLLDNALKYSDPSDVPELRLSRNEGWLRIEIRNRAEPLDEGEKARLFRCFSRLPRHYAIPGAGVGLYMSARFIQEMGGKLGVVNTEDGVAFWLELPALPEPRPEAPALGPFQEPAPHKRK